MSSKCLSQNCNRKAETNNNQNLCILCFDWHLKCNEQAQTLQQSQSQHLASYQELSNIHQSLSNGVAVDQNRLMRALLGSMMDLMSRNGQVIELKEEIQSLSNSVKEVEKSSVKPSINFLRLNMT